ncbi:MAG: hypothetical protein EAZ81_10165 [Verrucomicrobia bacterium]|nr:MAG: hypothetical protein EAZ81_10165 [Verrucomicrobiota bacterium]
MPWIRRRPWGEFAVFPFEIEGEAAACADAADGSAAPGLWQRGQQMNEVAVLPGLAPGLL